MPFGTRKIDAFRTLTTESLSVFIPFRVQDIFHENGIYYGQNVISKNMIIADRKQLLNGNSFILGVSGGGKSFAAKGEIINQVLSSDADIIIIDPEREYSQLVNAMGGEVINISATSDNHINAMDMNKDYGDGANWFKSNGKWQDRTYEPKVGDIIFFDWEGDGTTDHVGIVEKCENGTVYTVEGNSGDACKQRQYAVGSSNIYGYGIPAY